MLFPRMTREAYYHVLECQGNNSGGDGRVDTAVMRCDSLRMLRLALGAPALVGDRLTRERPWHSPVVRSPTVHGGIPGRPGRFESSRWGEKRARQEARLRELGLSAHLRPRRHAPPSRSRPRRSHGSSGRRRGSSPRGHASPVAAGREGRSLHDRWRWHSKARA